MNWEKLLGTIVLLSLLPLLLTIGAVVLIVGGAAAVMIVLVIEHARLIEHWYHKLNNDELAEPTDWWDL